MAWDAGVIEARLTVSTAEASADLAKIEAQVKALEDRAHVVKVGADTAAATADLAKLETQVKILEDQAHLLAFGADTAEATAGLAKLAAEVALLDRPHVIKISAVFDDADIGLARRAFMLLDNAISYDAMQRLRSSPQGSVLGALNALFSPHPVIGGPSPEQSAANGLLGQMVSAQGGGAAAVPPGQGNGGLLRDVVTGAAAQDVTAGAPGTVAATTAGAGAGATAGDAGALADAADAEKGAAAAQDAAAADTAAAASDLRGAAADLKASAATGAAGGLQGYIGRSGTVAAAAPVPAAGGNGDGGAVAAGGMTSAAAAAMAGLDEQVRKAYDDYALLAGEMNDLRQPAVLAALPELNQFDAVLKHISTDLEALSQPGQASADALARVQADLEDAGTALDRFEQAMPGAVADLDAMRAATGSSAAAAVVAGARYANVTAEMAALGGEAKASGNEGQSAAAKLLGLAASATTAASAAQFANAAQKAFTGTEKDVGAAAADAAAKLSAAAAASTSGGDASRYAYAQQTAQALSLKAVAAGAQDAAAKTAAAGLAARGAAGNVGFLQRDIALFGGALGAIPWVGTVTGLHLVIDGIIETAAEIIPAAIAFGAFAAAAVPAVKSIYDQEKALYTVSQAFNQQMPGLSGGFAKVAAAVKPQVYVLFGEALNTMNRNTGTFMKLATGAGGVLDNLGARAEMALGSKGVTGFAAAAVDDLRVLGNITGNVFGIFGNFLKVVPGYANILFHAIQDVTGALEAMTGSTIVQGILSVGLAFHGAIVWGGLAASGFVLAGNAALGLVQKFGILKGAEIGLFDTAAMGAAFKAIAVGLASMGADLLGLDAAWAVSEGAATAWAGVMDALAAVNPLGWIAIGIGAIAGLVVWLGSMKTASQEAFDAFQKQIAGAATFTTAFTSISEGAQQVNAQLAQTPKYITVATAGFNGFTGIVTRLNPAWAALAAQAKAYGGENATLASRMSELDKITGSQANTLADLNQLGIKAGAIANESAAAFANQKTQVQALAAATTQLAGFTGGQAAAAQNALTNAFMTGTLPAIQKVTTAEGNLLSMITGAQSSLDTFEQGIGTLAQNLNTATGSTATVATTLANLKGNASLAGAAIGGTSTASYALNQAFLSNVMNAQKTIAAMQMQGASAGKLTTVTATMAGQMLGFAGTNTEARNTIMDLINAGLGKGTVSMQSLNHWVAKNSTSLGGMNTIMAQTTINASQLAGVLQGNLNQMLAQAAADALGGQKALDQFAKGVLAGDSASALLTSDGGAQVISMFKRMYQNDVPKAKSAFIDWAENGLGLSNSAATTMWKNLNGGLTPAIAGAGNTAATAAGQIDTTFASALGNIINVSPGLHHDLSTFSSDILATGNDSTKTQGARAQLIKDLENAGLTAQQATGLVDGMQQRIDALHGKTVQVGVHASGSGSITATENIPGGFAAKQSGHLVFFAGGGRVAGAGSGDTVPAMLTPGEVVVPRQMVAAGAVDHLRGSLPGFAAGGLVGAVDFTGAQAGSYAGAAGTAFARAAEAAFRKSVAAAQAAAAQAAAASFIASGGAGSGIIEAMFKTMAAQRGWTGAQLTALLEVESREAGFNMTAKNPVSGAYGLAQFINGPSEYAQYGGNATTATGQITAMLNYIAQRYGTPEAAWSHELSAGWYDQGGYLNPGYTLAYNGTGKPERVSTAAQESQAGAGNAAIVAELRALRASNDRLLEATRQIPAGVGQHVGGAISGAASSASFRSRYPGSHY